MPRCGACSAWTPGSAQARVLARLLPGTLEAALLSGDLRRLKAAATPAAPKPWRRWVAVAFYLNKDWKEKTGALRAPSTKRRVAEGWQLYKQLVMRETVQFKQGDLGSFKAAMASYSELQTFKPNDWLYSQGLQGPIDLRIVPCQELRSS
eukprot:Skav236137  [mRNA]  locus=scaffold88:37632:54506:- [translate_table: standard]